MKKTLLFVLSLIIATSLFAKQGGTLISTPTPIVPEQDAVINYDGTGTNFTTWTPKCFVHAWLVPKTGEIFSKSYGTAWATVNGDIAYANLDAKVKMTHDGVANSGKYSITINVASFFNVDPADMAKIGQLGIVVRTEKSGDDNQTNDFLLSVNEIKTPSDRFSLAYGEQGKAGWAFPEFTDSGDGNKFILDMTLPADITNLSCYVGYNNGGTGNPTWTAGKSETILMSSIANVTAGAKGQFSLYKDSPSKNWYLSFTLDTATALDKISTASIYALNGTIYASGNLEIFTLTGLNVTSENGNLKGAYIVKVDGKVSKIMVK